tara:strand:- start:13918 stop:14118 length:201 start_codon:yes stop_codon:yes gene_type:complete
MKIKAKGGSLPSSIDLAGLDFDMIKALRRGQEYEVEEVPFKIKDYVEEVSASVAKPSKAKTTKKEV